MAYIVVNMHRLSFYFEPPMLFMPIFLILVMIFFRIRPLLETNMSISAYMTIFLEPTMDGINWETRLYERAKRRKRRFDKEKYNIFFRTQVPNLFLTIAIYVLFLYILWVYKSWANLVVAGGFNTLMLIVSIKTTTKVYHENFKSKLVDEWEEIKKLEQNENTAE